MVAYFNRMNLCSGLYYGFNVRLQNRSLCNNNYRFKYGGAKAPLTQIRIQDMTKSNLYMYVMYVFLSTYPVLGKLKPQKKI